MVPRKENQKDVWEVSGPLVSLNTMLKQLPQIIGNHQRFMKEVRTQRGVRPRLYLGAQTQNHLKGQHEDDVYFQSCQEEGHLTTG